MTTPSRKLIVGVDYGTTYSGVSYVWSNAVGIEDVHVLDKWGSSGRQYSYERQVPSKITYSPNLSWGYHIDPGALAYSWTKLLLDRFATINDFDDEGLRDVDGPGMGTTPPGKSPEDVVTDYLTQLYKHVMADLERETNTAILDVTLIEFWFTVPAMWSIRAQNATRDAAIKAGFGQRRVGLETDSIHMIKEPEAAAISCLNELIIHGESPLVRVGNGVLVCDCGGGTVDLASYIVKVAFPKLELDQACVSEGGKCGSTTIDRAFHKLMRQRFGNAFTSLPLEKKGANSKFMIEFESAKKDFGTSQYEKTYRFVLKMRTDQSIYYNDDDEVLMSTTDMKSLFDPVVRKIIGLLEQQIQATKLDSDLEINTIILVGGFGESLYLFNQLKAWCPESINLMNPPKSWEAICLGAAVRGLEGPVVPRKKSRWNIGHQVARDFRPGVDLESEAYLDFDGTKSAPGYMDWMIARGEVITADTTKARSYFNSWRPLAKKTFNVELLQCEMAVQPEKRSHHAITTLGQLKVDLSSVDFDRFESKTYESPYLMGKQKIYKVIFDLVMVFEDNLGYMYGRAVVHGKKVGEVRLTFGDQNES